MEKQLYKGVFRILITKKKKSFSSIRDYRELSLYFTDMRVFSANPQWKKKVLTLYK